MFVNITRIIATTFTENCQHGNVKEISSIMSLIENRMNCLSLKTIYPFKLISFESRT